MTPIYYASTEQAARELVRPIVENYYDVKLIPAYNDRPFSAEGKEFDCLYLKKSFTSLLVIVQNPTHCEGVEDTPYLAEKDIAEIVNYLHLTRKESK